jgi:hypothetical protein
MSEYSTLPSYEIPAHVTGDTWSGIPLITLQQNGSAVDLSDDAIVKMQVRFQIDSPSVIDFSTEDNTITIMEPATAGNISFPEQIVSIPVGVYQYDIKVIFSTGKIKTYLRGIWNIISHCTR